MKRREESRGEDEEITHRPHSTRPKQPIFFKCCTTSELCRRVCFMCSAQFEASIPSLQPDERPLGVENADMSTLDERPFGVENADMSTLVMAFKDTLAKIFLEKGLVSESCQLADFKPVAMEIQCGTTWTNQHISPKVVRVFKLIVDVVCAVLIKKIKVLHGGSKDRSSQTDLTPLPSSIKKEQLASDHDDSHDDHLRHDDSHDDHLRHDDSHDDHLRHDDSHNDHLRHDDSHDDHLRHDDSHDDRLRHDDSHDDHHRHDDSHDDHLRHDDSHDDCLRRDDSHDDHLCRDDSHDDRLRLTNVPHCADSTPPPDTPSTTTTSFTLPSLRRSSRSSVLNRKPLTKAVSAPGNRKTQDTSRLAVTDSCKKTTLSGKMNKEKAADVACSEGELSSGDQGREGRGRCRECERVSRQWTAIGREQGRQTGLEGDTQTDMPTVPDHPGFVPESCLSCGTEATCCAECSKKFQNVQNVEHHQRTLQTDSHAQEDWNPGQGHQGKAPAPEGTRPADGGEKGARQPKDQEPMGAESPSGVTSMELDQTETAVKREEEDACQEQKGQGSSPRGKGGSLGALYEVTSTGLYRCAVCSQQTKDRSNMRKHILRWHAGEQQHGCPVCGKAFTYPESLKCHMKVHADPSSRGFQRTPQGRYRCKLCSRECGNRSNIVKHVNRKHLKAGEKPYKCSRCSAAFGYVRSLKRHQMAHDGVRPYPCPQCDKQFFDTTSLRTHSRVHTNERPYVCQLCGHRFRQKEGLKGHMRSHTGDKPYVCDRCGTAFAAKRSLTRHIRVHTGERPYACGQCVAAFADWTTLHNHKLVHRESSADADNRDGVDPQTAGDLKAVAESRPFQCQFCGIRYADALTLKRHLRIHAAPSKAKRASPTKLRGEQAGEGSGRRAESPALHLQYRPYVCEQCGAKFKHLRGYTTHRSKHLDGSLLGKKVAQADKLHPAWARELGARRTEQVSRAPNSGGVGPNPVDMPALGFQPSLPPPPPPPPQRTLGDDGRVIDGGMLSSFPSVDPGHQSVSNRTARVADLLHYASDRVTQIIQYEDGSLGHVTTLLPHPPPPSSLLQPVEELLDNVNVDNAVTVDNVNVVTVDNVNVGNAVTVDNVNLVTVDNVNVGNAVTVDNMNVGNAVTVNNVNVVTVDM